MKKRNLKKWMIGLLSLALMFSNLPQVVHAQDTVHEAGDEASLRSALSEAEAGETITLTGSFSLSADIRIEKDVEKLSALYHEGRRDAEFAYQDLLAFLG